MIWRNVMSENEDVLHWYDFLCPFCYVGQTRTAILTRYGLSVIELPFQAHPNIPASGVAAGSRTGAMYGILEREAKEAGLTLRWPPRLPNTRLALAAAEWVRRHQAEKFEQFRRDLFSAHYVLGEDLGDLVVIDRHASELGIDVERFNAALADSSALLAAKEAEAMGRRYGARGTPAWFVGNRLVSGLLPAQEFEHLAELATGLNN